MSRAPSFDRHQFYEQGRFLQGNRDGVARPEDAPSGLSYSDLESVHIIRAGNVQPERRLPTPGWAMRDDLVREVLVAYLEERFYTTRHRQGTLIERLRLCREASERYLPKKKENLDRWLARYRQISETKHADMTDEDASRVFAEYNDGAQALTGEIARNAVADIDLRDLEVQIMNVDTDIYLTERGHAEMVAAVIYLYYRMGWNSVSIAEELKLKSPHVRQVLYRLNQTWIHSLSQKYPEMGTDSVKIQAKSELNHEAGNSSMVPGPAGSDNLEPLFVST